jgi:hypothetical protein
MIFETRELHMWAESAMYIICISIGSIGAGGVFTLNLSIGTRVLQLTADSSLLASPSQGSTDSKHLITLANLDGSGEDA